MSALTEAWTLQDILNDIGAYFSQEREFIKTNPLDFSESDLVKWVICRLYVKTDVWEVCLKRALILKGER